jgi:hypothetical protein
MAGQVSGHCTAAVGWRGYFGDATSLRRGAPAGEVVGEEAALGQLAATEEHTPYAFVAGLRMRTRG